MADLHFFHIFAGAAGQLFREEGNDPVVQPEQSFLDGKADGGGGKTLAEGKELMRELRAVGLPPAFGDGDSPPQQDKAMYPQMTAVDFF